MASARNIGRVARAARLERVLQDHEAWDRARLVAHQRERVAALVAHAIGTSPFYREFYGDHGVGPDTPLEALPPLDKPTLMEHWDRVVTDRRLRLADAWEAIEHHDGVLLGAQVMATGGSSRVPGVLAYDRSGWDAVAAQGMRLFRWAGVTPRLPRRWRVATLYAPSTRHMAARIARQIDVGMYSMLRLPASAPLEELAASLEAFRPEVLNGYAGTIGGLAAAQLDGRLRITPQIVVGSSEPLTDTIRGRVREAWGVEPFNWYATTETGPSAGECRFHSGLHVSEELAIFEPQGDRVLVTNLANRLLPLIRFAVDDLVTWEPGACPCGMPLRRIATVQGRADDVLELPGADGRLVSVHPTAWSGVAGLPAVGEFEIVQRGTTVTIRVAVRGDVTQARAAVLTRAQQDLGALGVRDVELEVETSTVLPRHATTGKRKVVRVEEALPVGA